MTRFAARIYSNFAMKFVNGPRFQAGFPYKLHVIHQPFDCQPLGLGWVGWSTALTLVPDCLPQNVVCTVERAAEVAAVHSMASPAASMMPSITRRKISGSSLSTKRLAANAPNISDAPVIRPLSATSGVSAPKRSKVTDLLT